MNEPQIKDIPSFQKLLQDTRNMKTMKAAMPFLRPFLRLLNADVDGIDKALSQVNELERMTIELIAIPDRFNDLFALRGWIIYDMLNLEIVKAAIQKAEADDIDGAETDLTNYYSPETIRWNLTTMLAVEAFRPRMLLAQKALIDYNEERYHACVPVVLALLDGMVNEANVNRRGFFAENVKLEAWDSIAAHSKGLGQLVALMRKGRLQTRTESITIPFRNGILHGMDLGYDNKMVAAKTWAALFAVRDWAIKAEKNLLSEPPQKQNLTLKDTFIQLRELAEDKTRLEAWQPRKIEPGIDIPINGEPTAFESETPERRLAEFLYYWKICNYGYMAKCLSIHASESSNSPSKFIREVRERYGSKSLQLFEILGVEDTAPAITDIKTKLVYIEDKKEIEKMIEFRVVYEATDGYAVARGKPNAVWIIGNWGSLY
jgi:hypothetical protein